MTFEIDTGIQDSALRLIPAWFQDLKPEGTDPRRVVHDYGYHLIGALHKPATMATVRKHTLAQWSFLQLLAHEWPDVFDEFWTTYTERVIMS